MQSPSCSKRVLLELPLLPSSGSGASAANPLFALRAAAILLAEAILADDDVQPRRVLLVLRHFGEVEALEVGEHADNVRPVVGRILDRVSVQGDAVQVLQWGEMLEIGEPLDLVPVKVDHLQGSEFEDVVADLK